MVLPGLRTLTFTLAGWIIAGFNFPAIGQSYFVLAPISVPEDLFIRTQLEGNHSDCTTSGTCDQTYVSSILSCVGDASMTPDGDLYYFTNGLFFTLDDGVYEIDTTTGAYSLVQSFPNYPETPTMGGFAPIGGGLFYGIGSRTFQPLDSLYLIDLNAGSITPLGPLPYNYNLGGNLTLFNGEYYYPIDDHDVSPPYGIVKLDISNPANSVLVLPSTQPFEGLTASSLCNTLVSTYEFSFNNWGYVLIHLGDGTVTPICDGAPNPLWKITSMREFQTPSCEITIDLDCNDSSGAADFDFNSPEFTCLTDDVLVTDADIGMVYDLIIEEMTIEITGAIPDAPFEILVSTGSVPNIDVSGDGTTMIILTNEGGATSRDFKDALLLIRYQNNAPMPTGGMRTVEVQFTTSSGAESNIATAFIDVVGLPLIPVDLGPDQQICEGETATFDAGIPNEVYEWSTGDNSQTITVDASGEYMVTVSDGQNCPGADTVILEVLPIVNVSLTGDTEICDNEPVNLTITTDTPFSLSIDISSNPGSPFSFPDINGNYSFTDLINEVTTYTITSVTPSQDACVSITDPEHIVDVYPTFNHAVEVSLCDGDSVWLGFYWETEAGMYGNTFQTFDGCDSVVTSTIIIVQAIQLAAQSYTCDSAAVGTFITTIDNPNGCDTIVTTTVSLSSSDTTQQNFITCILANAGTTTQVLTNIQGCDSLIITNTTYEAPTDTTFTSSTTCDSALLGISQLIIPGQDGCDSLIVTNTILSPSDTTYAFGTSCDPGSIGVFQSLLQNQSGCDSLVITTINAGLPDTSYQFNTSCDSMSLGVFEMQFVSANGCDSVVFNTVTYSAQDSTFQTGSSCDPDQVGVFVSQFSNQFGCDSIVTLTVSLLTIDSIFINNITCDPDQAGTNIQDLQNIFGCDSIVITSIMLLPTSATNLFETTCHSAEAGVFVTSLINQYGCDSIVTNTVTLTLSDTTTFTQVTCDPALVGSVETLFTATDGCDSLVIESTVLFPLPEVLIESVNDYNGFDISCEGGIDGSASAIVSGVGPFTYLWSTGDPDQTITGLSAGDYAVTITDSNGCESSGLITLVEPYPFIIAFEISQPDCFETSLGTIQVQAQGGVAPYTYSIDGTNFQDEDLFVNLSDGIYQITALDANDCATSEIISIHVPISIQVELGDDQTIALGDSAQIQAVVNLPFDSIANIQWTGITGIECPNCLTQIVSPIITTAYSITVSSTDGCADSDSMTVFVSTDHNFYIPNIFSPNGDGINDVITVHTSDDVESILAFSIFDRWGNLVFQQKDSTQLIEWDGRVNGKALNPGVFTYLARVKFRDGLEESVYGDITLIR